MPQGLVLVAKSRAGVILLGNAPKVRFASLCPCSLSLIHLSSARHLASPQSQLPPAPLLSYPQGRLLCKGGSHVQRQSLTTHLLPHRRSVNCSLRSQTRLWSCPWTTAAPWTWMASLPRSEPSMRTLPTAAGLRRRTCTRSR
jgi:hypothetical protein